MRVPLATNSYVSRSLPLSAQRLVNFFPEIQPPDAKSKLALFGTPGLTELDDAGGSGPCRGIFVSVTTTYMVIADTLYSFTANVLTSLGTIEGSGPVYFAENNGGQIAICAPPRLYVLSAGVLSQVTDPDFPGAGSLDYMDGYGLFNAPDTGQFWITALNNFEDIDALDFVTAESAPDNIRRVLVDHREVWLFGDSTIELWVNTGAADFPFERQSGAIMEKGIAAGNTANKLDNSVYWLGNDYVVYKADGYTPIRISTHAIEYAIENSETRDEAIAFSYEQEGHAFYVLTLPPSEVTDYLGQTFVYDVASGLWHERQSGVTDAAWRVRYTVYDPVLQKYIAGDDRTGKIYEMSLDVYTENGETILSYAVSPPIHADSKRAFMPWFQVEIESGVGLTTGQGSNPQMILQTSDDGGHTWSNERYAGMGAIGQYNYRARWRRLGKFRERYMRVGISDPVKRVIIAADTEITVASS